MVTDSKTLARPSMQSNGNALKHGLYAKTADALRLRTRRVRRLVRGVYDACPWLQDSDTACVKSWAELEIMTATIFTYLEATGLITGKEKDGDLVPRRLLADYAKLSALKLQREMALGLTPVARAQLRVAVGQGDDLALKMSRGQNGN